MTKGETWKPKITAIGCGNMGGAILSCILRKFPEAEILAIDPAVERARALLPAGAKAVIAPSIDQAPNFAADTLLLATKPQTLAELATRNGSAQLFEDRLIVSILAGLDTRHVCRVLQSNRVVRVMPNLPVAIGEGMTAGYASEHISPEDKMRVASLFMATGQFTWLEDEALLDAFTAVAGSGPGYLFAFAKHFGDAASLHGLSSDLSREIVAQTLLGAAKMLSADSRTADELKAAVTSKAGTTEAALTVLESTNGLPDLLSQAVSAAIDRAKQLSREA